MNFKLLTSILPILFLACSASNKANQKDQELLQIKVNFEDNLRDVSSIKTYVNKCQIDSISKTIEGNKSLYLPIGENEVFKAELIGIEPSKIYRLSYWSIHKTVFKIVTSKDGKERTTLWANREVEKNNGWVKKELIIHLPMIDQNSKTEIVINKPKDIEAWIDNIIIREIPKSNVDDIFQLNIDNEEFSKLQKHRENAAHSSIITSKNKKWIKGTLNDLKVKMKLKGDWTDHISEGIWSLKLSSKEEIFDGQKSFNIQTPLVRNFHKEWIFFELCKENGLTAPDFDFQHVSYYGSDPFYCAFEGNFSHHFVERKLGYKSPVLRFYEDHIFPYYVYSWSHPDAHSLKFETSYIYPYDDDYYSEKGRDSFEKSAEALRELINGNLSMADYDKWATLFAITSLTKSFHGLAWHNQRFFLNKNNKIEPIPYDGNTPAGAAESWNYGKPILGDFRGQSEYPNNPMYIFQLNLLKDSAFRVIYAQKLAEISNTEYLQNFISKRLVKLSEIYSFASPFYDFDTSVTYLTQNAERITKSLQEFESLPNSLFNDFFAKAPKQFEGANIPLEKKLQDFVIAIRDGEKIKVINGTGKDVKIEFSEKSDLLKNNSFIEINNQKELNKLKVIQKDDPTITFQIEVVNWTPVVK